MGVRVGLGCDWVGERPKETWGKRGVKCGKGMKVEYQERLGVRLGVGVSGGPRMGGMVFRGSWEYNLHGELRAGQPGRIGALPGFAAVQAGVPHTLPVLPGRWWTSSGTRQGPAHGLSAATARHSTQGSRTMAQPGPPRTCTARSSPARATTVLGKGLWVGRVGGRGVYLGGGVMYCGGQITFTGGVLWP